MIENCLQNSVLLDFLVPNPPKIIVSISVDYIYSRDDNQINMKRLFNEYFSSFIFGVKLFFLFSFLLFPIIIFGITTYMTSVIFQYTPLYEKPLEIRHIWGLKPDDVLSKMREVKQNKEAVVAILNFQSAIPNKWDKYIVPDVLSIKETEKLLAIQKPITKYTFSNEQTAETARRIKDGELSVNDFISAQDKYAAQGINIGEIKSVLMEKGLYQEPRPIKLKQLKKEMATEVPEGFHVLSPEEADKILEKIERPKVIKLNRYPRNNAEKEEIRKTIYSNLYNSAEFLKNINLASGYEINIVVKYGGFNILGIIILFIFGFIIFIISLALYFPIIKGIVNLIRNKKKIQS